MLKALGNLFRWFLPRGSRTPHPGPNADTLASAFRERKFDSARFEQLIGYHPKNWAVFYESLLHRSYLQYLGQNVQSNERLEFLGDAILNSLVADYLYCRYPSLEEGDLTKIRSRLVNRKALALRAKELHLSDYMLLSSSALQSVDSGSDSILADAFEAVIGALYLDGGLNAARTFVLGVLLSHTGILSSALTDDNYKSALLEYAQGRSMGVPRYAVVKEDGPDHDRRFTVEVFLGSESLGVGIGRSKKDAEQAAAAQGLEHINNTQPVITETRL
ncbi:MAG: ribonuclease III [Ignavibacteriales bacterium]|nr:ribonuclease III [Ignavibacteriales bacterium]